MIRFLLATGLAGAALAADEAPPRAIRVTEPPQQAAAPGADRVTSSSGQFTAEGGGSLDRAAVVLLAEEAKSELLRLTEEKDEWDVRRIRITLQLHGQPGDKAPARSLATSIFVTDAGFEVHIDAHLGSGLDLEQLKFAVTAGLVYERTLRKRDPKGPADVPYQVPPWFTAGLREATAWRLQQSDRRLYSALFKTGGLFKTADLFAVGERDYGELDGATRAAFRVSSGALVMALLQQPQGKDGFKAFLGEVADYQGEMPALLRRHFPELNLSETSLSKWWALQLAQIGGQNLATDILSIPETESALGEALRLNFRTPEGITEQKDLAAWTEVAPLPEPERVEAVRTAEDALVRLSYRCFPSYRPLLSEYQSVLGSIARGRIQKVPDQLRQLGERRAIMVAKAEHARDYLDWFEITRARDTSGAFDDYLRLKERLRENPQRREDHLSQYLDRMQAIFGRGAGPDTGPPPPTEIGPMPGFEPLPPPSPHGLGD